MAVWITTALVGCGTAGDPYQAPEPTKPRADLESRRSPERAALAWWQALRARDLDSVLGLLTASARSPLDASRVGSVLNAGLGDWAEPTAATALYTERPPQGRVTVFMRIEGGAMVGRKVLGIGSFRLALPLVHRGGRWLIDNSAWLRYEVRLRERLAG